MVDAFALQFDEEMTKPAIFPGVNSWLIPFTSEDLAMETSLNLDVISYQNKYLVSLSTDNKLGVFVSLDFY